MSFLVHVSKLKGWCFFGNESLRPRSVWSSSEVWCVHLGTGVLIHIRSTSPCCHLDLLEDRAVERVQTDFQHFIALIERVWGPRVFYLKKSLQKPVRILSREDSLRFKIIQMGELEREATGSTERAQKPGYWSGLFAAGGL